ncbi:MAG: protease modulator HflK, partial [Verrucomicrobiales bacterium]
RLREVVTTLDLGLRIDTVQLKNVNPPKPVQDSFDEVNRAQQEREQMINQANGDYNKVIPKAAGEAEQKISAAEGYALKRVNEAEGDGSRFTALLKEYDKAPEVTRRRIFLETVQEVIPGLDKTVIIDEDARNFLPMLQLPNGK